MDCSEGSLSELEGNLSEAGEKSGPGEPLYGSLLVRGRVAGDCFPKKGKRVGPLGLR
jgi:hypothetical protein